MPRRSRWRVSVDQWRVHQHVEIPFSVRVSTVRSKLPASDSRRKTSSECISGCGWSKAVPHGGYLSQHYFIAGPQRRVVICCTSHNVRCLVEAGPECPLRQLWLDLSSQPDQRRSPCLVYSDSSRYPVSACQETPRQSTRQCAGIRSSRHSSTLSGTPTRRATTLIGSVRRRSLPTSLTNRRRSEFVRCSGTAI